MGGNFRWTIAGILLLLYLALGINWMAVTPLFPVLMDEMAVDRATVSLLFGIVALAQAVSAMPAGVLAARIGPRWTVLIGAVVMSAGLLTPLIGGFLLLLVSRVLFGLGTGLMVPTAAAVAVQWLRPAELVIFNGLGTVAMNAGNSIGLFLPVPLADAVGWRGALAVCAAVSAAGAAAWLVIGRENREHRPHTGGDQASVWEALRQPSTYWLAAAFAGPISYFDALVAWLPTYYNQVFGRDLAESAAITGLLGLAAVPAALSGGFLSARVGLRRPFLAIPGLLMGVVGLGTFMVDNVTVNIVAVLLFGFLTFLSTPVVFTVPMELPRSHPALVAMITSVILTVAGFVSFFAPILVGFLADQTGSYLPGFLLSAAMSFPLLLASWRLPETGPNRTRKPAAVT